MNLDVRGRQQHKQQINNILSGKFSVNILVWEQEEENISISIKMVGNSLLSMKSGVRFKIFTSQFGGNQPIRTELAGHWPIKIDAGTIHPLYHTGACADFPLALAHTCRTTFTPLGSFARKAKFIRIRKLGDGDKGCCRPLRPRKA